MDENGNWTLSGDAPAEKIVAQGFVHLDASRLLRAAGLLRDDVTRWEPSWDRLPPDTWLRDGGRYRRRRHSVFVQVPLAGTLEQAPHRAHWQPVDYNALHGGIERMFEPIEPVISHDPRWHRLLSALGLLFAGIEPVERWYIEAHQFRIDTSDGVGRPTPEGAHRDGVDYVAVIVVARQGVRGGETRVFEAHGPRGIRFVMEEPWSAVLLDDARVVHEATPILPDGKQSHRDTLVLTYRRAGFQAPA